MTPERLARFEADLQRKDVAYVRFGRIGGRAVYTTYVGEETSPTGVNGSMIVPVTEETTALLRQYGHLDSTGRWAGQ